MCFKSLHGWVVAAADAPPTLIIFAFSTSFTRMEMGTSQMGSSIIVSTVDFPVPTVFAVGEEVFVRRCINANVFFSRTPMCPCDVAFEFVRAPKPLRPGVTMWTHDLRMLRPDI